MKPAAFKYVRAESVAHAVETLAQAGEDGKIIAGGQSLMPMINFRLVQPSVLVDINRIVGLDSIEDCGARLRLGALVRHRMTGADPLVAARIPVLHAAMKHVAHLTVRNRGTFCGSLCHADPAAEMPMMALLLNAQVRIASPRGERMAAAADFLQGAMTTDLAPDEMATHVEIETMAPGAGWGFEEFARRHGDYALAAVAVILQRRGGRVSNCRIALMGAGESAGRSSEVEAHLEGSNFNPGLLQEAVALLRETLEPREDLAASADYRRHLAGALFERALRSAWARAEDNA